MSGVMVKGIAGEDLFPRSPYEEAFGILVTVGKDFEVTRATGETPGASGFVLEYVRKGDPVLVVLLAPLVSVEPSTKETP